MRSRVAAMAMMTGMMCASGAHAQEALTWGDLEPDKPERTEAIVVVDEPDTETDADAEPETRVDLRVNVAVHGADADANDDAEENPPARGKHFFAEVAGGLTFGGDIGGASQVILGAGGRLNGGWLRFYAVFGLGHATLRGSAESAGQRYLAARHHLDVVAGLRVYIPVVGPVRLFTDFLGGGSHVWSRVEGGALGRFDAQGWRGVANLGFGLQVRVTQKVSVGGRLGFRWSGDPLEDLAGRHGIGTGGARTHLTGSATWHF